jgi:hypothetical protein
LKEEEVDNPVADVFRKHGVSDASISIWKANFCALDGSETERLRALEDENVNPRFQHRRQRQKPTVPVCMLQPSRQSTKLRRRMVCPDATS